MSKEEQKPEAGSPNSKPEPTRGVIPDWLAKHIPQQILNWLTVNDAPPESDTPHAETEISPKTDTKPFNLDPPIDSIGPTPDHQAAEAFWKDTTAPKVGQLDLGTTGSTAREAIATLATHIWDHESYSEDHIQTSLKKAIYCLSRLPQSPLAEQQTYTTLLHQIIEISTAPRSLTPDQKLAQLKNLVKLIEISVGNQDKGLIWDYLLEPAVAIVTNPESNQQLKTETVSLFATPYDPHVLLEFTKIITRALLEQQITADSLTTDTLRHQQEALIALHTIAINLPIGFSQQDIANYSKLAFMLYSQIFPARPLQKSFVEAIAALKFHQHNSWI